jgi:ribosomal protein L16 Arg81 hydroxylase
MIKKIQLNPIPEVTYNACIRYNKPVLITGVYSVFPNLAKWDLDYAAQKIAEKETLVLQESSEKNSGGWKHLPMQTGQYFKKLKEGFINEPLLYMAQQNIDAIHPELHDLVEFDKLIPQNIVKQRNFWLGPGGTKAPLHMDPYDNFFMQLMGSKKFYLFSPTDTKFLYAHSPLSKNPEFSKVSASNIDLTTYPNAKFANSIQVHVTAGEILFLPAYWWHEVVNSPENSISINLWCRTKLFGNIAGMKQLMPRQIKEWLSSKI